MRAVMSFYRNTVNHNIIIHHVPPSHFYFNTAPSSSLAAAANDAQASVLRRHAFALTPGGGICPVIHKPECADSHIIHFITRQTAYRCLCGIHLRDPLALHILPEILVSTILNHVSARLCGLLLPPDREGFPARRQIGD